ncbi:hypothetical protein PV366_44110, partial [Streptomyces ipomoeae]|nr:hypothetical protein [Streptomyces ipomoeae]
MEAGSGVGGAAGGQGCGSSEIGFGAGSGTASLGWTGAEFWFGGHGWGSSEMGPGAGVFEVCDGFEFAAPSGCQADGADWG